MHPKPLSGVRGSAGPILTVGALCRALGVTTAEIRAALELDESNRFRLVGNHTKSDGTTREVYNPHPLIRKIQRRLVSRVLSRPRSFRWPEHLYGSIPNGTGLGGEVLSKDYVACARRHCGAKSLLKLDIKNFFGNVHRDSVYATFRTVLGYGDRVSKLLACLCTHKGTLPQGGLTSSYLAMLSLSDLEGFVVEKLRVKALVYTRYVDDITISSKVLNYDFAYAMRVVENMLTERGLPLNSGKTRIERVSTSPLTVHGLRVAFSTPRLPAEEVGRIRASVKYTELLYGESNFRFSTSYRKSYNRCMGRVNKLKRVGHVQHGELVARLRRVQPLASKKDLVRAYSAAARLERDHKLERETFGFHRRFFMLHERINLIARTYPQLARNLRSRLRVVKPEFS